MRSQLVISFVALFASAASAQSCFFANGTQLPNRPEYNEYQPCTIGGPSTICCGINRPNQPGGDVARGGFTKDECLPNGMCQNRVTKDGIESTGYFADFCSDKDIKSNKCLDVCGGSRDFFGIAKMTPCTGRADSERWCCGNSNACCSSGVGVINIAQVFGGSLGSSSSSSSSSSTSTTKTSSSTKSPQVTQTTASRTLSAQDDTNTRVLTVSSNASGTNAPSTSGTSSPIPVASSASSASALSGGAIAGIVIGALAAIALLCAAIFFFLRAQKYKKQASQHELGNMSASASQNGYAGGFAAAPRGMDEPNSAVTTSSHDGYSMYSSEKYAHEYNGQDPYAQNASLVEMAQPPSELAGAYPGYHGSANELPASTTFPKGAASSYR